ncbi:hypothetical protein BT69DRAFT_1352338 [Atractiella rhizophila]|nr:hypothetical protein BT69DRAFT_1354233 [Atractiella rhizophila]KAH8920518.1 hypothetical protein BT69DRAFT_1352338 [Atractiella rhizophila]
MPQEKKSALVADSELGDICDEGGKHVWNKAATPVDYFLAVACCPCYIFLSLVMSQSSALANPLLEQCTGNKRHKEGEEATCIKCGLTRVEAQNLNEARRREAQNQGNAAPGYFSSQMRVPEAVA